MRKLEEGLCWIKIGEGVKLHITDKTLSGKIHPYAYCGMTASKIVEMNEEEITDQGICRTCATYRLKLIKKWEEMQND